MNYSKRIGQGNIHLNLGDITQMNVDAIVNPANDRLILGGGVAGAIARAGGPSIQGECNRIGGTYVGGAVITGSGNLQTKYVIHAVGPRMGEGDEDDKLKNATLNSLKVAEENQITSIAFPAISTGIYGYPMEEAAKIALFTVINELKKKTGIELVRFVLFDSNAFDIYNRVLKSIN